MKRVLIFLFLLGAIFINAACSFQVLFLEDFYDFLIPDPYSASPFSPPSAKLQQIMFLRGAIFTLIGLVSILILLLLALRSANFLRSNRRLAAFVLVALVVIMLVSTAVENPLRYIPCCGDGPTTHWGYPYAWLSCGSYSLCDWPRVDWLAVLANLLLAANVTLISTGTLALFRKDVSGYGTGLSAF